MPTSSIADGERTSTSGSNEPFAPSCARHVAARTSIVRGSSPIGLGLTVRLPGVPWPDTSADSRIAAPLSVYLRTRHRQPRARILRPDGKLALCGPVLDLAVRESKDHDRSVGHDRTVPGPATGLPRLLLGDALDMDYPSLTRVTTQSSPLRTQRVTHRGEGLPSEVVLEVTIRELDHNRLRRQRAYLLLLRRSPLLAGANQRRRYDSYASP